MAKLSEATTSTSTIRGVTGLPDLYRAHIEDLGGGVMSITDTEDADEGVWVATETPGVLALMDTGASAGFLVGIDGVASLVGG